MYLQILMNICQFSFHRFSISAILKTMLAMSQVSGLWRVALRWRHAIT
jgi:hypothetical protein